MNDDTRKILPHSHALPNPYPLLLFFIFFLFAGKDRVRAHFDENKELTILTNRAFFRFFFTGENSLRTHFD